MKCVVAGGAGFIGSHLVTKLLAHNNHVIVLDDFSSGMMDNLHHVKSQSNLEIKTCDITDAIPPMDGVDMIFHLAASANPTDYEKDPLSSLSVNSVGNEQLIECANSSQARYMYFSSSEIYGHHNPIPNNGLSEECMSHLVLNQKRSPYFIGKIFGESLVGHLCQKYSLQHIIIRPFNVYGTRMDKKTCYGRVIPNFMNWAHRNEPLRIHGDGIQERSFCHVDDFIDCIMRIVQKPSWEHSVVNIGNPEPVKIRELAKLVIGVTRSLSSLLYTQRYKYEPKYRTPNIHRVHEWLHWRPRIQLQEGLIELIENSESILDPEELESDKLISQCEDSIKLSS